MLSAALIGAVSWVPRDVSQFWVEPDKTSNIEFEAKNDDSSNPEADAVKFVVRTTDGELLKEGHAEIIGNNLTIQTEFPQGYYELELPDYNQAFGVASQPAYCPEDALLASQAKRRDDLRSRDPFFGIDSASTWLVRDDKTREALIRNARRIGIATYRERLNWGSIEPKENSFNYEGDRNSRTVRKLAQKYDMPVLELFHSAPEWAGHIGKYPEDLIKTANSWGVIGKRWNSFWNSIEVWNEPDIGFSGNLPADQYADVLKTVAQELARDGIKTPVVGGIIASFSNDFMKVFAENNGLEACDIFSFHTYCRAPEMESICLKYHDWLVENHAEWKPVWITECGRPWKKGTDRPNREADLASAIDIVQKGVVAKAMGLDSYFPFVYVFYEENDNNFGMSDKNSAPLRSIAGYARMIYLLSGKECLGSLNIEGAESARLFADPASGEQVAVVYASAPKNGRSIKLPIKPLFVERVTGERIEANASDEWNFADGFLFVSLPKGFKATLADETKVDKARNLRRQSRESNGVEARHSYDVVMRFDYDKDAVAANNSGYSLNNPDVKTFVGKLSLFNFSYQEKKIPLSGEAVVDEDGVVKRDETLIQIPSEVVLPARGKTTIDFSIDAAKLSPLFPPTLFFKSGDERLLAFKLSRNFTEANFKESVREFFKVDVSNQSAWQKSCSSNGSIEFNAGLSKDGEAGWGFSVKYASEGDKWAYPLFALSSGDGKFKSSNGKDVALNDVKGVAFRVKGTSNAEGGVLRFFTYSNKGTFYFTPAGFAPTDGKERFIVIPFTSLGAYGGTPDPFSPDRILRFSIGGNSKGTEMRVEVGDFYFFR